MKSDREKARVIIGTIDVLVGIVLIIMGTDIRILKDPISSTTMSVYHLQGDDEMELGNLHQDEVVRCVAMPDDGSFNAWIENEAGEIVSDDLTRLRIMFEVPADGVYFLVLSGQYATFTMEITVYPAP